MQEGKEPQHFVSIFQQRNGMQAVAACLTGEAVPSALHLEQPLEHSIHHVSRVSRAGLVVLEGTQDNYRADSAALYQVYGPLHAVRARYQPEMVNTHSALCVSSHPWSITRPYLS